MEDQQLFNIGTVRLKALVADLAVESGPVLTQLLSCYRKAKENFAEVVSNVDADSVCRECKGQCCLNGKYRINVFDALALVVAEIPASANFSQKPLCPYGTDTGCTMKPGFRPADCVLFICDAIEQELLPRARLILAEQELDLRECIREASCLTGEPVGTPLLLWAAKK